MVKTLGLAGSLLLGFLLVAAPAYLMPAMNVPTAKQPFAFNHQKHVAAGWKCANCHPYVDHQTFAGLPRAQDCVDCHKKEAPKHPGNAAMQQATDRSQQLVDQGQDWQWTQVHDVARYVYFSHRRHVEVAKLDCANCHGDVAKMRQPFARPVFPYAGKAKMNWCIGCHERKHVSTDCLACHH